VLTEFSALWPPSSLADQVEALVDSGVEAAGLTSNLGADEASALLRDLFTISPKVKVLYVTPEKIKCSDALNNAFQKLYDNGKLNLFVIDEAHCVSQWGHDFRPDYLNLKVLKQTFPRTPLMALTVRGPLFAFDCWQCCGYLALFAQAPSDCLGTFVSVRCGWMAGNG
jgi:hypothetical protein